MGRGGCGKGWKATSTTAPRTGNGWRCGPSREIDVEMMARIKDLFDPRLLNRGSSMAVSEIARIHHAAAGRPGPVCPLRALVSTRARPTGNWALEMDSPRGPSTRWCGWPGPGRDRPFYVEPYRLCLPAALRDSLSVRRGLRAVDRGSAAQNRGKVRRPAHGPLAAAIVFSHLLVSRGACGHRRRAVYLYEASGCAASFARRDLRFFGRLDKIERLARRPRRLLLQNIGKVFGEGNDASGWRSWPVASPCLLRAVERGHRAGAHRMAARSWCRGTKLLRRVARALACARSRALARRNIDALLGGQFDAFITNAAGCGSTLKEYHELLEDDPAYRDARGSSRGG